MALKEIARLDGVDRIRTHREMRKRHAAFIVTLIFAVAALWSSMRVLNEVTPTIRLRPPTTGDGPLISGDRQFQFPVELNAPDTNWVLIGAVTAGWVLLFVFLVVVPLLGRFKPNNRHRHLATPKAIKGQFGAKAARATGKFTLPGAGRWARFRLPTSAFALRIGDAVTPKGGGKLWADHEKRIRIVAASGWGKTHRLLIPMIRALTGSALVTSIEPDIFLSTVVAREMRWPDGRARFGWTANRPNPFAASTRPSWARWLPEVHRITRTWFPVFVVDCSPDAGKVTGKYPSVHWNPIPGCANYNVATRRAKALVKGVDAEGGTKSSTAAFFEESSSQTLAAWLHAAALTDHLEVADLAEWLAKGDLSTPEMILATNPLASPSAVADPIAVMNMLIHMDPQGERTTSGVKRYLTMALSSLLSGEGRKIVGSRTEAQFDMAGLVLDRGTLYLLAEPEQMEVVRPLLSLLAAEMFWAAESVARHQSGPSKRLRHPFYGVLDEIHFGVRVANLPYVANTQRKFGVSLIWACTNGSDEVALYGEEDAKLLRGQAGVTIYGGFDEDSHEMITAKAGPANVVLASRSHGGMLGDSRSESEQSFDVLTAADQQKIGENGGCIVIGKGISPFLASVRSTYERPVLRRRIKREVREVTS